MKKYNITGMSCAACSARVEKAVSAVEGVSFCSVNLLTNSMTVEGACDTAVIDAVVSAGYGASVADAGTADSAAAEAKREVLKMKNRLILSIMLLLPLMYVTMCHVMLGAPMLDAFVRSPVAIAITELILAAAVIAVNRKFFIVGFKGAIKGSPNMDTLVALGSGVAFLWSVYLTVSMAFMSVHDAKMALHSLSYESAAMILTLITVGKLLESIAKGKTTSAIEDLIKLTPDTAILLKDGKEIEIPSKNVTRGDVFIVKAGQSVPVDGVVLEGGGATDESALTGESIPVEKTVGDTVYAATINTAGYLICRAERVGEDTAMAKVVKLVSDAAASKAPIAKLADRVAGIFVPVVMLIALATSLVWFFVNNSLGYALARGISVLVISCPCALGLATPVAIMVGAGIGAKGGALFKTASSIEMLGRVKTVVFDKTGTLTNGAPVVTDIFSFGTDEGEVLSIAYSLERKSEHPLSAAITKFAEERSLGALSVEDFSVLAGRGVSGKIGGVSVFGVSLSYAREIVNVSVEVDALCTRFSDEGKTPLVFIKGDSIIGVIAVADTLKSDAKETVRALRSMGIRVIMLTGDNERTANAIANELGGCEVIAGVLPDGKEEVISSLGGGVCMVGDGINDAPALVRADVGVAIGHGADIAIDSADVVLVKRSVAELAHAISLSRTTLRIIKQNLFWAFIYNVVGIPIAAGVLVPIGVELSPMFGAAAMSLSSFTVVMNALRLNLMRIFPSAKNGVYEQALIEKSNEFTAKDDEKMKKTFNVDGMMCPHCEAHVVKALLAVVGIESATASHKEKTVVVEMTKDVEDAVIISAITNEGYKVF